MLPTLLSLAMLAPRQQPARNEDRGASLYRSCKTAIDFMEQSKPSIESGAQAEYCRGYLTAFNDVRDYRSANFCPPEEATIGTSARIYVLFMEKNPLYMDRPSRDGLLAALQQAYPCPVPQQ